MKKLMKKKVNIFGKGVPVFAIAIFSMVLVSAALLPYFGQITGLVTVSQGLLVDGGGYSDGDIVENFPEFTSLESKVFVSAHELDNQADVDAEVQLVRTCKKSNEEFCDGDITTSYNLMGSVELSGKSDCYAEGMCTLDETPKAIIYYTVIGDEFVYEVESDNINVGEYTLVYYPDTDGYTYTGNIIPADEITESLPVAEDLNGGESSTYCTNALNPEDVNCQGAKLWLIPTTMINFDTNEIIGWNGDAYLFETDLIIYNKEIWDTSSVIVPKNSNVDFVIVSNFPKMLVPDEYTITTTVEPVTA